MKFYFNFSLSYIYQKNFFFVKLTTIIEKFDKILEQDIQFIIDRD